MSSAPEYSDYLHASWPVAAIFSLWVLVSMGILALGAAPLDLSAFHQVLIPLFALFFIVLIASSCALFTLFQEPYFLRFAALRRVMILGSLGIGVTLAFTIRHLGISTGPAFVIASANLIVFALLIGNYLISALKKPSELIPVCVVMSVADLFSVFAGPSKQIAATIETYYRGGQVGPVPWSDFLLIKIAVPDMGTLPVFGVADVIILAFLSAAAKKFSIPDNLAGPVLEEMKTTKRPALYLPIAALGLASAVMAAQVLNVFLPALPVIALFFLGYTLPRHPEMRQMQKTEWVATLVGFSVLFGLAAGGGIIF